MTVSLSSDRFTRDPRVKGRLEKADFLPLKPSDPNLDPEAVKVIQKALRDLGFPPRNSFFDKDGKPDPSGKPDGIYGQGAVDAVKNFQRAVNAGGGGGGGGGGGTGFTVVPFSVPRVILLAGACGSPTATDLVSGPPVPAILDPTARFNADAARAFPGGELVLKAALTAAFATVGPDGRDLIFHFNAGSGTRRTFADGSSLSNEMKLATDFITFRDAIKKSIESSLAAAAAGGGGGGGGAVGGAKLAVDGQIGVNTMPALDKAIDKLDGGGVVVGGAKVDYKTITVVDPGLVFDNPAGSLPGTVKILTSPSSSPTDKARARMFILVHGTQRRKVTITGFSVAPGTRNYTADLEIEICEHFGFDENDLKVARPIGSTTTPRLPFIPPKTVLTPNPLAVAWVLQHEKSGGPATKFVAFAFTIEAKMTISGTF